MNKNRQSIRLRKYDYSKAGAYFVTICTQNKKCFWGNMVNDEMVLNDAGRMLESVWSELPERFPHVKLGEFVIMPNHFHGIVIFCRGESCIRPCIESCIRPKTGESKGEHAKGEHKVRPYGTFPNTLGRIMQAFKSITTNRYIAGVKQKQWPPFPGKLWQRNYYEHIVRDENELNDIRKYIMDNPRKWDLDRENPNAW
ncbi:MAG: transposase [Thermodesulfobacteriota bacterium]|nr:transposase [Thermodesulfobacteriota bacterium]